VRGDGRARLLPAQLAESALPHGSAATTDDDGCSRKSAGGDSSFDDVVDHGEPFAGHANGLRRLHGKAAAGSERERRDQQRQQNATRHERGVTQEGMTQSQNYQYSRSPPCGLETNGAARKYRPYLSTTEFKFR